jgi:hypothetical protein
MTLPTAPVFTLYDRDLLTVIGVIHPIRPRVYMIFNDIGSFEMTLPITDTYAHDVEIGRMILCYYGDTNIAYFIEYIGRTDASEGEHVDRVLQISGRQCGCILDDAIVWDWQTPGLENVRRFGTNDIITSYGGAPVAKGLMLYHLFLEARDDEVNGAGQHINRFCWREGGILAGDEKVTWIFTDTLDSNSVAWGDAEDMEFRVGMSLLDVIRQMAALGYAWRAEWEGVTGSIGIDVYKALTDFLYDASASVEFKVGVNVLEMTKNQYGADLKNALLLEVSNLDLPYYSRTNNTSIGTYRRRESLLQAADAYSLATTLSFGDSELDTTANPKDEIFVTVTDAVAPHFGTEYFYGYKVTVTDYDSASTIYYIKGIILAWEGDNPAARVVLELEPIP